MSDPTATPPEATAEAPFDPLWLDVLEDMNRARGVSQPQGEPRASELAEATLVQNLSANPDLIPLARGIVRYSDFFSRAHGLVFHALCRLHEKGASIDEVSVVETLTKARALRAAGDEKAITDAFLAGSVGAGLVSSARAVEEHSRRIAEYSTARRIGRAARDIVTKSLDWSIPVAELVGAARVIEADASRHAPTAPLLAADSKGWADRFEDLCDGKGVPGLSTGFPSIDSVLLGMRGGQLILLAARPSVGKAQPLDAQVLTPRGFVTMGSLRVGDVVTGSDGRPCRVTGVYPQGVKPVFRVTTNDGAATECCDEHLWFTQTRNERRTGIAGSVKRLVDVRETLKIERGTRANHHLPVVAPVEFVADDAPLPMAPYLLGLLLGDGDFTGACLRFTNVEDDVRARFCAMLPAEDATSEDDITLRVKRAQRLSHVGSETMKRIDTLGLRGVDCYGKFIPSAYLSASVADRLELLRGLLDTDGYVNPNGRSVEFSTSAEKMAEDVVYLVRSLGGIVTVAPRVPTFTVGDERRVSSAVAHRMVIRFPSGLVPISSAKHLARWRPERARSVGRYIDTIEPVGEKECQCIAVDAPDHLYVTDGFIVTHNTALALCMCIRIAAGGVPVLFVSLEMTRDELLGRAVSVVSGVPYAYILKPPPNLSAAVRNKVGRTARNIEGIPLYVSDPPTMTASELSAHVRAEHARRKIQLVVVDYAQLVKPDAPRAQREQEVREVADALKALAKSLNVPVIALAQLNREVEKRSREPVLADLRESGALEQNADVVAFLHVDDDTAKEYARKGPMECREVDMIFRKVRSGQRDVTVKLGWTPGVVTYNDLTDPRDDDEVSP